MIGRSSGNRSAQADSGRASLVEGLDAMSGNRLQHLVRIRNPDGFHMRPVTAFVEQALRFQSTVTVSKGDRRVNGKSVIELLFLGALEGSELLLEASGPDAQEALEVLIPVIEREKFLDEDPDPPLPPKG